MKSRLPAIVAFLLCATVTGAAYPASASVAGVMVAASRCNGRMINDFEGQIRNFDGRPPRDNQGDLQKRFNDINAILNELSQERGIIDSVCNTDNDKAPLFAQIGADAAWGLVLESDIALRLNQPCTAAAAAISKAILAQAWLDIASVINDNGGTVPGSIAAIVPKVQSRAATAGLALPAFAQTSAYWRDGISAQAKTAIAACPSPSPSASP